MLTMDYEITTILSINANSTNILRRLYEHTQVQVSKYSVEYFCHKIVVISKGHFILRKSSDEKHHRRYWASIAYIFQIIDEQVKSFFMKSKNSEN